MPRTVWTQADSVEAVAELLERSAKEARAPLAFEPAAGPSGRAGLLHQAALLRARRQLSLSNTESDRILGQEVRAIDDLVRTANLLVERLREWYALHAPEATRAATDPQQFAALVAEHGERAAVMKAIDAARSAETSLGTDLAPEDMAVLQGFAQALAAVHASWNALEARVAVLMETVAPNVASVVGPVLGARLIAISGGLSRLATWPAGTVQLLGAETALFRHLKEGTRPPKHGILFQHPLVHQAAPWNRGPIARALALAAGTAAKADAFTRNDLKAHLAAQLKADLERIAQRKPKPKPAFNPRFQKRSGPSYGRDRRDGPPPAREGFRGPPRDDRGPPRQEGFRGPPRDDRGPPRQEGWRGPPRDDRGPPRQEAWRAPARDDRGPPREGYRGPPRDDRGPPREGYRGPPRDDRGPARDDRAPSPGGFGPRPGQGGAGKPFKRKPQGAFRSPNKPAPPPGSRRDRDDGGGQ